MNHLFKNMNFIHKKFTNKFNQCKLSYNQFKNLYSYLYSYNINRIRNHFYNGYYCIEMEYYGKKYMLISLTLYDVRNICLSYLAYKYIAEPYIKDININETLILMIDNINHN